MDLVHFAVFVIALAIVIYKYPEIDNISFIILALIFGYILFNEISKARLSSSVERFVDEETDSSFKFTDISKSPLLDLPQDIKYTILPKFDYIISAVGGDTTQEESRDDVEVDPEYYIKIKDPSVTKTENGVVVIDTDKFSALKKQFVVLDNMLRMVRAIDVTTYEKLFPT